jgi:Ca2+/Na+ antiporter
MSFADRFVLWLHIGFAIFTIGPVTVAIMSTPRYIRQRNLVILRYLYRITRLFAILSLGVLIAGLILAHLKHDFSKPWLTVSMTLFVVSLVLLVLIVRDQHRAIATLEDAEATAAEVAAATGAGQAGAQTAADAAGESAGPAQLPGDPPAAGAHLGHVERGRIVSLGGVVSLIWLVILVLMVWNG